jgi:hypothetical protein
MQDAADDAPIVRPLRARAVLRQVRLDRRPGLVTDPINAVHERSSANQAE